MEFVAKNRVNYRVMYKIIIFLSKNNYDFNIKNKNNETLIDILIKNTKKRYYKSINDIINTILDSN